MRGRRRAWDLRTSSCPLDFFSALFVFQTKNGNRIKVVVNELPKSADEWRNSVRPIKEVVWTVAFILTLFLTRWS